MRHARRLVAAALLVVLPWLAGPAAAQPARPALTVFAAADLAFVFKELIPLFEQRSGARVTLVLGSSGTLARQIEHGAPADVFFSADRALVDDLSRAAAVIPETRSLYAQGRLALAVSKRAGLAVRDLRDLERPAVRRIAIANPEHAPYGRAAREALQALSLWERLRPRLVYGENVRHALQFVQAGAAEAALVALSIASVPEVDTLPVDPRLHRPLDQMAAVVRRSGRPELGLAFLQFVQGAEGRPLMKRHGFLLPGEF
ncbi:MAG: molybdate ABC transporter substrate-binding protein [Candidatus Rokubacteria bacterium]|nr:molybdate ABC transporter substrate-binding protein [Candidatus Rokubacteria bacterium]